MRDCSLEHDKDYDGKMDQIQKDNQEKLQQLRLKIYASKRNATKCQVHRDALTEE